MHNFRIKLAILIINLSLCIMPKGSRNRVFINNLMCVGIIEVDKDES